MEMNIEKTLEDLIAYHKKELTRHQNALDALRADAPEAGKHIVRSYAGIKDQPALSIKWAEEVKEIFEADKKKRSAAEVAKIIAKKHSIADKELLKTLRQRVYSELTKKVASNHLKGDTSGYSVDKGWK